MGITVRNLTIGDTPKICAVVMAKTKESILELAQKALSADLIEWRADAYKGDDYSDTLKELRNIVKDMPIIFTFRTKAEGGSPITIHRYKKLLLSVSQEKLADLIDIEVFFLGREVGKFITMVKNFGVKVIGSYHDIDKTPDMEELIDRFSIIDSCDADILKIAVMPLKKEDVTRLITATVLTCQCFEGKPVVAISMGDLGRVTRIIGKFTGSAITFATFGNSSIGQFNVAELKEIFDKLNI